MQWLDEIVGFVLARDALELIAVFWYFLFFDFTRYLLLDGVLLVVYMFSRRGLRATKALARRQLLAELPLVSVIAPGKNEGKHIPALVESLERQTYPNIEIVVVDDGSDDDTAQICRRLERAGRIDRFFRNDVRGGKASAANLALHYCRGDYVVHLDADCRLRHDSIENILLPFFWRPNVGAVAGDIRVDNIDAGFAPSLQAIEYMKGISVGRAVGSMLGILRIVSGAYGAFRRDLIDRIKGWDVGPGLDGDITLKIRKLHHEVHFEPDAVCYTNVPDSFVRLARQRYRWDKSLIRFRLRKHFDLLLPSANFRWRNFFSSAENLFFNLVLDIKWWIYIVQIVFFYTEWLPYIFTINYVLYLCASSMQFVFACVFYGSTLRRSELALAAFLPLVPIYTGLYLRLVRSYAYLMEFFFKTSYHDPWNPWKTSRVVRDQDL